MEGRGMKEKRSLHKSRENRVIFGVAGGLGEYFDVDPMLVRVGFVGLLLAFGASVLIYFILAIVMQSRAGAKSDGPSDEESLELGRRMTEGRKPLRSRDDKMIFGVAGGLAQYFEIDAMLVRVGFVGLLLFAGSSFLVYFILAILMPREASGEPASPT